MAQNLGLAYARWIIRWRWPVVIACLLAVTAAGWGVHGLEFASDYRVFFGPNNPQLKAFESLENTYTKTDNILFVLQPRDKKVFSRETLGIVEQLTEEAWRIPHAIRVDSITNFQHTEAEGDELTVADLVENSDDLSDAGLARIENIALNEPALVNRLIAADARTTGTTANVRSCLTSSGAFLLRPVV